MISTTAFAADLDCVLNVESVPGSDVYNKNIFWEKADTTKQTVAFLYPDGTLLQQKQMLPGDIEKVPTGSLIIIYGPVESRFQMMLAKAKRNKNNVLKYTQVVISSSSMNDSKSVDSILMAHGASMLCKGTAQ